MTPHMTFAHGHARYANPKARADKWNSGMVHRPRRLRVLPQCSSGLFGQCGDFPGR
jgi:hypothetical protein